MRKARLAVCGAVGLLSASSCTSERQAAEAPLAAPTTSSLDIVRSHAAFRHFARGEAAASVELPSASDGATVLHVDGSAIEIRPLDVLASRARASGQGRSFVDVAPSTELLLASHPAGFEEIRVLSDERAPTRFSWAIRSNGDALTVRKTADGYEVLGHGGRLLARALAPWALDANDRRVDLKVTVASVDARTARLDAELDARGLRYPIVVDPTWISGPKMDAARVGAPLVAVSGGYLTMGGPDAGSGVSHTSSFMTLATSVWTAGPDMLTERTDFAAIELPLAGGLQGALIVGGNPGGATTPNAEIFVPQSGPTPAAFRAIKGTTPSLPRFRHTLHALPGGRVLAIGGLDPLYVSQSGAELFDPTTESFSPTGSMANTRAGFGALTLGCGDVLVAAGYSQASQPAPQIPLSTAERYVAATGKWVDAGTLHKARYNAKLVALPNGRALLAGGYDGSIILSDAEVWDPSTNSWSVVSSMPGGRQLVTPMFARDGHVVFAGGQDDTGLSVSSVLLLSAPDAITYTWSTSSSSMAGARDSYATARFSSGDLLYVGGQKNGAPSDVVEVYSTSGSATVPVVGCPGATDAGVPDGATTDAGATDAGATDASVSDAPVGTDGATTPPSDSGSPTTHPSGGDGGLSSGTFKTCAADTECPGGLHCVEHVCCDTPCTDKCHSCRVPGAIGICSLEPAGIDIKNECGAPGTCVQTCDGRGGCVADRGGEQCAAPRCADASHLQGAATCTGAGSACPTAASTFDCAPYLCVSELGACLTSCRSSADCLTGYRCDIEKSVCVSATNAGAGGCGCEMIGARGAGAAGALALVFMGLGLLRRRNRHAHGK